MNKITDKNNHSLKLVRRYFPQVDEVVDSNKPAIAHVTRVDVAKAKIKDPNYCAFAQCLERMFKADGVIIGLTTSYVIKGKRAIRFQNTETVKREITSFDRKAGFDEGYYNLSLVSPSRKLGRQRTDKANKRGPHLTKADRKYRHFTQGVRVLR